jgi:hypothetical protein
MRSTRAGEIICRFRQPIYRSYDFIQYDDADPLSVKLFIAHAKGDRNTAPTPDPASISSRRLYLAIRSLRQRCLAYKMRNLAARLSHSIRAEFTQAARAAYQAPSPALARLLRDDLVQRCQKAYPSAVRCVLEEFEACIVHLSCPPSLRKVIRTSNLLERLFEEERRRTRTIHFFGKRPSSISDGSVPGGPR